MTLTDPAVLNALRARMLRFATLQLGDPHAAEDAVQEALMGALANAQSFRGQAALRTWVFAILKNKIADALRQRSRIVTASRLLDDEEAGDTLEAFDARGHWNPTDRPATWADPESALQDQQFWKVFEACLDHLPGQQARLFMMREFVQLETEEICRTAGISTGNLNVTLHRARSRLRACLEDNWFVAGEARC